MEMQNPAIDGGTPFDWGKTSADYARYRDIYPSVFYERILRRGLCHSGQHILDLGTGTGVLPRNLYHYGARWTAIDRSPEQIEQAIALSQHMDIAYAACSAEEVNIPDHTLDAVTACQCFWYFDHSVLMPKLHRMLKPDGSLLVLYMAWLPFEDPIAGASERLALQFNPGWSGAGETMHPIHIPACYDNMFHRVYHEEYTLDVPFTRASWHGRMKTCRGVGASLSPDALIQWEQAHLQLLMQIAPQAFTIRHYAAIAQLQPK